VGEVFAGRYELVDLLDSGGSGSVWRVWDHREHAYRAAKVLRQSDSDSLLRFVQETSRRITHPHVVAPYGWSGEDDRVLFTMPLIQGGSLAQMLADYGALPVGFVGELTAQALAALVAVHDAGLVHRDVKPGNLLLDATGGEAPHLWLSDFGASAQLDAPRLTRVGTMIGTPGYFAPEQVDGADLAPAQDVYSLGVVVMQLLTGAPPQVDGRLPDRPPGRSAALAGLWDLCLQLTSAVPADRPSAVEALRLLDAVPGVRDLAEGADPANPVEVFSHLPELPDGWDESGPVDPSVPQPPRKAGWAEASAPGPELVSPPATRVIRTPQDAPARSRSSVPPAAWVLAVLGLVLLVLAVLVSR
jgi:serine/threonine protein kinase